jgi:thiol-disulfide isomerase/thioredoxin
MLRMLVLVCLCLLAALAPRAAAQDDATLAVGSAAPPLVIDQWPRGVPVTRFERGRVYVVEFWATWCTPCHLVVPKLTELQRNNPALTVIGVAASEQATTVNRDDRLEKVQNYITKRSDEIGYTMAYDGSGETWSRWMVSAQRGGIPAAFIVGPDGRLAWIGNPLVPDFEKELAATLARPDVNKTPAPTRFTGVVPPRNTQLPPRTLNAQPPSQPASQPVVQAAPRRAAAPLPQASAAPRSAPPREFRIEFVPDSNDSRAPQRTPAATQLTIPELEAAAARPTTKPTTRPTGKQAANPTAAPTRKPANTTAKSQTQATKPAAKKPATTKKPATPTSKSAAKPGTKPTKKSDSTKR